MYTMSFTSSLSGSSMPLEVSMSQQHGIQAESIISFQNEIPQQAKGVEANDLTNSVTYANITPSQKMRKKRHRPKVIKEDKSTSKERCKAEILETPINKEKGSAGKRKYVRKIKAQTLCENLSNELMSNADPALKTGISMFLASETPNKKEITPSGKRKYVRKKKPQDLSDNTSGGSAGIADHTPRTEILESEISVTPNNKDNTASGKRKYVQKMKRVNLTGSSTSTLVEAVDSTLTTGAQKSASTKTPNNKEITPPGMRKYAQKKKTRKVLDHPSDAQIASTSEIAGAYSADTTKPVRRCLNYDVENLQSTYEQGKEYLVQDSPPSKTGSSFVKSNMQSTPGLELVVGTSKEFKFDLNIQMHPVTEVIHFADEPQQHFRKETMEANDMQDWQRKILGYSTEYQPPKQELASENSEKQASISYSTDAATKFKCQESGGTQPDSSEILNLLTRTKQSHTVDHDAQSSMHDDTMVYNGHYLPYPTQGHEKKKKEPDNNKLTYKTASPSKTMQSDAWTKSQEHHMLLHTPEAFTISSPGTPKVQQFLQHMPFEQAEKVFSTLSEIPAEPHNLSSPRYSANRTKKQNKLLVLVEPFPDNSSQQQTCKFQNFAETKVEENKGKRIRKRKEEHKHNLNDITSSISIGCSGGKALHSSVSYHSSNLTETNSANSYSGETTWYSNPIDEITQRLRFLTINEASKCAPAQMQNAIAPYCGGDMIVPYESITEPKKKRRPQPKVDLDPETNKVWNLLMGKENIDNVEGTNSEKEKWWHEERRIFRGRVDSFIARMHLVQGDRRFSKWKGSVVDSVVGVFLTQNVSDHLSSSAFMALAAKYPVESRRKSMNFDSEDLCVESQESCVTDRENTTIMQEQVANQHYSARTYLVNMEGEDSLSFKKSIESNYKMQADTSSFGVLCANEATAIVDNYSPDSGSSTPVTPKGTSESQAKDRWSEEDKISSQSFSRKSILLAEEKGQSSWTNADREVTITERLKIDGIYTSISSLDILGIAEGMEANFHGHMDRFSNAEVGTRSFFQDPLGDFSCKNSFICSAGTRIQDARYVEPSAAPSVLNSIDASNCRTGREPQDTSNRGRYSDHEICSKVQAQNNLKTTALEDCKLSNNVSEVTSKQKTQLLKEAVIEVDLHEKTCICNAKLLASKQAEDCLANQTQHCANNQPNITEGSKAEAIIGQCTLFQGHYSVKVQETNDIEPQLKNIQPENLSNQQKLQNLPAKRETLSEACKGYEISTNEDQSSYKKFDTEALKGKSIKRVRGEAEKKKTYEWDKLRKAVLGQSTLKKSSQDRMDSVNWEAVRCADVDEIAKTIKDRGMSNVLGGRIKAFLNRLVTDHGSIDLEWLRDVEPDKTKDYLLSVEGLGLKSVECVRLLTLHHMAFPVDTNVGRICVRLGWVPLQPLPESLQLHLLELYPVRETIQRYLWPRLCKLDQRTLYELHYQMITFGKVFCTKSKPNCNACPMRGECKHFASAFASTRLALPGLEDRSLIASTRINFPDKIGTAEEIPLILHQVNDSKEPTHSTVYDNSKPIIEEPDTPEAEWIESEKRAIEDAFYEDPDEIPTIELNFEEFKQNLQIYMQANKEIQGDQTSKALVPISPEAASIPMPKLKNVSRLRTEHCVYEIPDSHPILEGFEAREPDDPTSYLLAIWTPGETAQTTEQSHESCCFQEMGKLCASPTCFSCNATRETEAQIVRGTILIPCRTAMRGSFPLNGTYFQVNEVFADHGTSWTPVYVPREWIWNLPRRTVYFGTSVPSIFKGLTTEEIQQCFWRGFICIRGFNRETRAPKPLYARLHFPASKTMKTKL